MLSDKLKKIKEKNIKYFSFQYFVMKIKEKNIK